ncbi:hypothetical protein JTE90_026025 [Oedothorax gibbosus]|uniref:Uncharacterized protein n=1 Tax=Oedothorax gibbosus TaxID=931172 RepID=A0AAV6TTQ0_9ARAC|nr:hypothetical protein JTE90_026025 [Oedothorax gibbosus]
MDLEHFAALNEDALFDFHNYENQNLQEMQTLLVENFGLPDIIEKRNFYKGIRWLNDYLICNKGFASFITLCFAAILILDINSFV